MIKYIIGCALLLFTIFPHFVFSQQNIYLNQVGYLPSSSKTVLTDYPADSFAVINTQSRIIEAMFPMQLKKENDLCSGMTLYEGDFSSITKNGNYLVQIYSSLNSGITSYPFNIDHQVFTPMINLMNASLYLQRCGLEMDKKHVGIYDRKACHLDEAIYHDNCSQEGSKDVTGGWHDAGDYGKYIAPGSVTVGLLLSAYELDPQKYAADDWNIPESGNKKPDVLDEVKYELLWMFKMQRNDGAVHEKIHTKDYVQFIMPSEGKVPQYIYEVSSTATADFSAIMAKASRIYKTTDETFANECLQAALKSYAYLEKHPEIFPEGGFKNPADTKAGGYSDANDKNERIWAAAELYISTQKKKYLNDFNDLNQHFNYKFSEVTWENPTSLGFYSLLIQKDEVFTSLQTELIKSLTTYCNQQLNIAKNDGFNIAMTDEDYVWGSNGHVLNKAINLLYGYHYTQNEQYKITATHHLDYILGMNPNKISYVTGVGTNRILHLHHAPTVADLNVEPIPGILSGGPNKYRNDESLMNTFDEDTPPALIFLDNEESYSSNENTIYTNASLFFVASYLNE